MQYEGTRAALAVIPEDHPARQIFERLLDKFENDERLTSDDLEALHRVTGNDSIVAQLEQLQLEREQLEAQSREESDD
jgi:hypothetical protein